MPIDFGPRILQMAEIYDPELCFPIALGLYAGLRSGEICNVRQKGSPLGPGIILQTLRHTDASGHIVLEPTSMEFDLRKEVMIRSDAKSFGKIKKERMATVFGPFVKILYGYYIKHLQLIAGKQLHKAGESVGFDACHKLSFHKITDSLDQLSIIISYSAWDGVIFSWG